MVNWRTTQSDFAQKAGTYNESKHPRKPRGTKGGGQFAPKMRGTDFERQSQAAALRAAPFGAKNSLQFSDADGKRGLENIKWFYENIEQMQRAQMNPARSGHEDAVLQDLEFDAETKMGETVPQMRYTLDQMQSELPWRIKQSKSASEYEKLKQLDESTKKRIAELDHWNDYNFSKKVVVFDGAVSQLHEDYDFLFHFVSENIREADESEEVEDWADSMTSAIYELRGRNARILGEFGAAENVGKSMGNHVRWEDAALGVLRKFAPAETVSANTGPQGAVAQNWNAQAHPRQNAGSERGGEFAPKPGAGQQQVSGFGQQSASGRQGASGGGFGAQGMMQPPTLPNVFRMFADESGTQANHDTWLNAGTAHGFDDTNARILARPLSTLHVAPQTQNLIMQRASEIHSQITSNGQVPRSTFDTWRYLKGELPFILSVNLPKPQADESKRGDSGHNAPVAGKGDGVTRVGGRQSGARSDKNANTARSAMETSKPKNKGTSMSGRFGASGRRFRAQRFTDGAPRAIRARGE